MENCYLLISAKKKKLILFESSVEKVVSGEGGIMPFCFTDAENYSRTYMLRIRPVPQEEKMRFVVTGAGTLELERKDEFHRVGMGSCCIEVPDLKDCFVKQKIQTDLIDFLDALNIPWTADTAAGKLYIHGNQSKSTGQNH